MEKLDCIKNYFAGTRALYLYYIGEMNNDNELKKFIVEKENIIGANVSLISTIMLGIKEDIVSNEGNLNYESKLLLNYLEKSVDKIAKKENDKYYLDGYEFNDAASIVAMIRNKMAHGRFLIDFNNNKLTLNHNDVDIKISIERLKLFIITAFMNYIKGKKTNKYTRSFCIYEKAINNRTIPLKTKSELKNVIRNIKYYSFELTCEKDEVPPICISQLEYYISLIKENVDNKKIYEVYKNLISFLENYGCTLKIENKKACNENLEEKVLKFSKEMLLDKDIAYLDQITILGDEVLKYNQSYYTKFEPLFSNINLLLILDAIKVCKTSNKEIIADYLSKKGYSRFYINYDEIGVIFINMFNTLYMYGFDDVYTSSGGYSINRDDEFDFSKLDLDSFNPLVNGIDYSPLYNSKAKFEGSKKKYNEVLELIDTKKEHLNKIKGNNVAVEKIKQKIEDLNNELDILKELLEKDKNSYLEIANDFVTNNKYFKNRAIINGIRNSIAHGHYEIISDKDFSSTKIIFSDIYQGKLTFKVELTFEEFIDSIENNFKLILDYLDEKKKSTALSKTIK